MSAFPHNIISKSTKGVLVCLLAVLILTPDTLLIRTIGDLHHPTLLFFRHGFQALSILGYLISQNGKQTATRLSELGWIGILCGLILGTSNLSFTTAVKYTAVANVLVITSLFSALFSWVLVGDVLKVRTAVTMLIGLGAIAMIFYDEISGGSSPRSVLGNILACCTCVLVGLFFAVVRYFETKLRYVCVLCVYYVLRFVFTSPFSVVFAH
jgi:drug/metabolite transporter (DMT)-like permease